MGIRLNISRAIFPSKYASDDDDAVDDVEVSAVALASPWTSRTQATSVLIFVVVIAALVLLGVHPLDSARWSAAVRRLQAEVDVLLRVEADDEGRDVDELLAHPDVTLADQNASVVDRLGQSELENLSLQTTLQEIFNAKTQNVI